MKDNNPYFYLASSQLFPFAELIRTDRRDNALLLIAQDALALVEANETEKALALYGAAIEQYPQFPFFYACRSLLNTHMEDEGLYDYQKAKKLDFNYHNFLEWQENKDDMVWTQELEEINAQMNTNDSSTQSLINRAMLWVQHFDYERAIEDYSMALANADNADVRVSRAAVFMRMLRYDMMLMDLEAAIGLNPNLYTAYLYRAKLYVCVREGDSALADFEEALRLAPNQVEIYEERASYYEKIAKWDAAITDYNHVIAHNPSDFYWYVLRADAYEQKGDFLQAITDYDEAIRLNPYFSDLYQYRGELKQRTGDEGGATADFNTFEELEEE